MDNTIDSLQIDIVQSATTADKSIDALVSSLKKLDRIGKSNSFSIIQKRLQGIAKVNFSTLKNQINSITKNLDKFKGYQNFLNNINLGTPTIDTTSVSAGVDSAVEEVSRAREEIVSVNEHFEEATNTRPEWLDDVQAECDTIIESYQSSIDSLNNTKTQITAMLSEKQADFNDNSAFIGATDFTDTLADKMTKLDLSATLLKEKMEQLKESGNIDTTSWFTLQRQLLGLKLQYSQLDQAAQKHSRSVDMLGKSVKRTQQPLGKLISKFGNVMMYRMIRYLLSQIMHAVTEGIQNVSKFSSEANNVMSAYKTEFLYIKNSLGSTLLPIMEALLPTVIRLGDAFVDIANSIGKISAGIAGKDTFIQAKKYAQDYKKSLDDIKKATVGLDEINVLSKVDTNNNYKEMFEEVEIDGWDIAGSVLKLATITASLTTLIMLIKGVKLGDVFTKMGKGIKTAWTYLKNASGWKKAGIAIAALATEAVVCYNGFYDATTGAKSWGEALLGVIPVMAAVGVAMYAMMGPVGLVIGLLVGVVSAIAGVAKASSDLKHKNDMANFFKSSGVEISQVNDLLDNYFRSINLDKQAQWNDLLHDSQTELIDAAKNYDYLWASISKCEQIDSSQIENLTSAFNALADAAMSLNDAAIESIMASIRTGIELNITPELTDKLNGLIVSLETAQDLINVKVSGIKAEYQQLLNEIASNGGRITTEQRDKLNDLRSQINTFTLTDNTSAELWAVNIQEAIKKGINAGTDESSIKDNINNLVSQRDSYLDTLKTNYASSVSTLRQLIELDKTQFNGALGFKDSDLDTLEQNYNAQIAAVHEQYNSVLQAIWDSFKGKALDYDQYVTNFNGGMGGFGDFLDTVGAGIGGLFGWLGVKDANGDTGWEHNANKETAKEQKEFLDWLASLKVKVPAHANGGFVEDGLFMANHGELVGEFANGKTAVANNEQIIEGIKQGVVEAIMETGSNQGGDWTIQIIDSDNNVKSEKIISAAERRNRRDGKTIIAIGG